MSERDEAKRVLDEVDALVGRHRVHDRMAAARREAIADGLDRTQAEQAAQMAARDPDEPAVHPVSARRDRKIAAALAAGRVSPVEARRFRQAMEDADEASVTAMLERMPEGRLPLAQRSHCPDPENPYGSVGPGPLPQGLSLLRPEQQREIAEHRR